MGARLQTEASGEQRGVAGKSIMGGYQAPIRCKACCGGQQRPPRVVVPTGCGIGAHFRAGVSPCPKERQKERERERQRDRATERQRDRESAFRTPTNYTRGCEEMLSALDSIMPTGEEGDFLTFTLAEKKKKK